jgi:hypothetical protein
MCRLLLMSLSGRQRPGQRCLLLEAKQKWPASAPRPKKGLASRIQRLGTHRGVQLTAAKVSDPGIRAKVRKFRRHFKGHFSIGNVQVRILPGQPPIPVFREFPFLDEKGPPNAGFSHPGKSLETGVRTFSAKNSRKSPAESRKTPVFWRLALETLE